MDLNPESFLGKMGYSVNRPENIRHSILQKAVEIHGKRRVADHIAWLISTRKGRVEQARAVKIWQSDLNCITETIGEGETMIIQIFKVSTKEMYTFPNKQAFYEYVRLISGLPLMRNHSIDDLMNYLPREDYCRIK